jgi:hypothetical protein
MPFFSPLASLHVAHVAHVAQSQRCLVNTLLRCFVIVTGPSGRFFDVLMGPHPRAPAKRAISAILPKELLVRVGASDEFRSFSFSAR